MEILAWILFTVLVLTGFAGLFLPVLPGFLLILIGALLHKLMLPTLLSWGSVIFTGVMFLVSYGVDFLGSFVGAKWGGATRLGMIGLVVGGFIGLFFSLPGILLGPLIGVFIGELIANRTMGEAAKAGAGATAGLAISTILKVILAFATVVVLGLDIFFYS